MWKALGSQRRAQIQATGTDIRMSGEDLPENFRKLLDGVKQKRPRTVIDHILEYGQITTEDLKDIYGYNHPPRAIRDVREHGIPLDTFRVTGSDGKKHSAYRFGDPAKVRATKLSGRTAFTSKLRAALIELHGACCNIYLETFPEGDLQIDHRIPFEILAMMKAYPMTLPNTCCYAHRRIGRNLGAVLEL